MASQTDLVLHLFPHINPLYSVHYFIVFAVYFLFPQVFTGTRATVFTGTRGSYGETGDETGPFLSQACCNHVARSCREHSKIVGNPCILLQHVATRKWPL